MRYITSARMKALDGLMKDMTAKRKDMNGEAYVRSLETQNIIHKTMLDETKKCIEVDEILGEQSVQEQSSLAQEQKKAIFNILADYDGRTFILAQLIERGVIPHRTLIVETAIRDLFRDFAAEVK